MDLNRRRKTNKRANRSVPGAGLRAAPYGLQKRSRGQEMKPTSGQKAAATRRRRAAGRKGAATRKRRAAGKKAAQTRKRRAAGRKAAATRKRRAAAKAHV